MPFADNVDAQIFFVARLPRTLAGALVGGTLAAAGVVFQGLLRNPLATPFTLGVSSGAALGAMLAITFGWTLGSIGLPAVPVASFAGSIGAVAIVYVLSRARHGGHLDQHAAARRRDDERVLLGADPVRAVLRRLRRDVPDAALADGRPRRQRLSAAGRGAAAPGRRRSRCSPGWRGRSTCSASASTAPRRTASTSARAQRVAFFSASLATGAAVSVGGPIGFVGIIVPHLVRLMVGADHRVVLPASALFGAAFLVGCDILSRTMMAPVELPVGIITALIGGPFFLWLLVRK